MAEKKVTEEGAQFILPPPKLSKWEGFKQFMWNGERGELMGRTGTSWGTVGLFYVVFYSALAAFFSIMLLVFYQTLDNYKPKWTLDSSVLGRNPGLGFRPMPPEDDIESTLIWFDVNQNLSKNHWIQTLEKFLEPYRSAQVAAEFKDCTGDGVKDDGTACRFDVEKQMIPGTSISRLGDCIPSQRWGYDKGKPCVAISLNRIYDWIPDYITRHNMPNNLPDQLKTHITAFDGRRNMVWLHCQGENPADIENAGPITYHPYQGFEEVYFPFKNQHGYLSPLVFIRFGDPKHGVLINIECRAYAHGIEHNRMERRGSVHFELMID